MTCDPVFSAGGQLTVQIIRTGIDINFDGLFEFGGELHPNRFESRLSSFQRRSPESCISLIPVKFQHARLEGLPVEAGDSGSCAYQREYQKKGEEGKEKTTSQGHRPRKTRRGVNVNGLKSVLTNTTAVTSLESRLYSVARTVALTMLGMDAWVTLT